MRRDVWGALRALTLPTLALAGVALIAPGRLELALRVYALLLAGVLIVLALLALRRAFPTEEPLEVVAPRARRPEQPPSLERMQNEVVLGIASSFDLHYRLVPRLREIASGLLASRRNVLLSDPERSRALLGADAWELVRPDREAPRDRLTTGIPPGELEQVVDALERV